MNSRRVRPSSLHAAPSRSNRPSVAVRWPAFRRAVVLGLFAALAIFVPAHSAFAHSPATAAPSSPQTVFQGPESDHDGELEILHEDARDGSRYHYFLKSQGARYALQFTGRAPE